MNPQFSHIRLIASDIDGTLLQGGRTAISERLFTQVRALKGQGIRFCAAPAASTGSLAEAVSGRWKRRSATSAKTGRSSSHRKGRCFPGRRWSGRRRSGSPTGF